MALNTETSTMNVGSSPATPVNPGDTITETVFQQMLNILNELSTHVHVFYDDYTTACGG